MKRNFGFKPYEGDGKCGFISYKSEDEKLVAPYAKTLHDKGVKLWYDYGIPAGEDWFQTISRKIVESSFMIVFVTERIFHSSVIQIEIQTAEMWNIPVVPVFLEKINRSNIPKNKAALLAKLSLKQGVDGTWNMSVNDVARSIYELIVPLIASDTEEKIQQRVRRREHQASLPSDLLMQSALSEVGAEEMTNASPKSDYAQKPKKQVISGTKSVKLIKVIKAASTFVLAIAVIGVIIWSVKNKTKVETDKEDNSQIESAAIEYDDPSYYTYETNDDGVIITGVNSFDLTELKIPKMIENKQVVKIGNYAFKDSFKLSEIVIPDSVTTIEAFAFWNCTGLTQVKIPDSVEEIDNNAFYGCSDLKEFIVSVNNKKYSVIDGVLFDKQCISLLVYPPNKDGNSYSVPESVLTIKKNSFGKNNKLTEIILNNLMDIENNAFYECEKLEKINCVSGNNIFCSIDGVLYDKLGTCLIAYPQNKRDRNYSIPDSVKTIGDYSFFHCKNLNKIDIPNSVELIGENAFEECTGITQLDLPNSVKTINSGAFIFCTGLKSISIPNSVTEIKNSCFNGCSRLTDINVPNSVLIIESSAFCDCKALKQFKIPDHIEEIDFYAFDGCSNLKKLIIPNFDISEVVWNGTDVFQDRDDITFYGGKTAKALADVFHVPYVAQ